MLFVHTWQAVSTLVKTASINQQVMSDRAATLLHTQGCGSGQLVETSVMGFSDSLPSFVQNKNSERATYATVSAASKCVQR